VNIACHVKQSSKTSFGGTLSWQWRGGMSSVRVVQTATIRILRHRFPGASETVGQVFKFVWRLHWKINAVCMSLSPIVSFKSRFVTYLLNFPRICSKKLRNIKLKHLNLRLLFLCCMWFSMLHKGSYLMRNGEKEKKKKFSREVSKVCYSMSLNACTFCDPVCVEIESVRFKNNSQLEECSM